MINYNGFNFEFQTSNKSIKNGYFYFRTKLSDPLRSYQKLSLEVWLSMKFNENNYVVFWSEIELRNLNALVYLRSCWIKIILISTKMLNSVMINFKFPIELE